MPEAPSNLRGATIDELEQALAHALRFDGRKAFKTSGEMMARITAAHLAEQLRRSGFVVMKKPPTPMHSDAGHYDPAQRAKPPSES
jgi:hypothetical protein